MPHTKTYQELQQELDTILTELQSDQLDIDQALKSFERGQAIVNKLQTMLKVAENKIKKLPSA